jgi:hypothetical protein
LQCKFKNFLKKSFSPKDKQVNHPKDLDKMEEESLEIQNNQDTFKKFEYLKQYFKLDDQLIVKFLSVNNFDMLETIKGISKHIFEISNWNLKK